MGQTKPSTYWRWTVPLNNAQMGLGALNEYSRCGAEEQTADHILDFCPLYHALQMGHLVLRFSTNSKQPH